MAMVAVDDSSLQAELQPKAWSEGRRPLGAVLLSSDKRLNSRNDLVVMMTALGLVLGLLLFIYLFLFILFFYPRQ